MLQKTIKFTDFQGKPQEKVFYFNLTKAEIIEFEMSVQGGLTETLQRLSQTRNGAEIMALVKSVLEKAYGERTEDGGFVKGKERFERFSHTDAYSELFLSLVTDANAMSDFVYGLLHNKEGIDRDEVRQRVRNELKEQGIELPDGTESVFDRQQTPPPTGPRPPVRPTQPQQDTSEPPLFSV